MFDTVNAFSGFSVDDIDAASAFYSEVLGLRVDAENGGMLTLHLDSGASILVYPKEDHEPASFTILNFGVADVDAAVGQLNERGVVTKIYDDMGDDRGIQRGWGPDIAWFRDPAGNVLSVLATARARSGAPR